MTPTWPLRLLLALNGVDAGVTLTLYALDGSSIELNPVMLVALAVSPIAFLVVKLAIVDVLAIWLASKPSRLARFGLLLAVCCYGATIFYQLHELTRP